MSLINDAPLGVLVVGWLVLLFVTVLVHWRRGPNTGLLFAYLFNLFLIHWIGAAIYLLPWQKTSDPDTVLLGFRQSFYGILAFAMGSVVLGPAFASWRARRFQAANPDSHLPRAYLAYGAIAYIILSLLPTSVPTLTALLSTGQNLVVAGVCLQCWRSWQLGRVRAFWAWLALTLALPLITTITRGFMGYGVIAVISIFAFTMAFYRPRWKMALIGLLAAYFGMMLYDSYMRSRIAIRDAVWGGAGYSERWTATEKMLGDLRPLDLQDPVMLENIDSRLNQNYLVGAAVQYIGMTGEFAHGKTIMQAGLALIPRIVWLDKPLKAGSGTVVTEYTGIHFARSTSVGTGQVMEFYINFGTLGVIGGFILLGMCVAAVDWAAAARLRGGDWYRFATWYLVGIAMLNVGGSFIELTTSAAASAVSVWLVHQYGIRRRGDRRVWHGPPAAAMALDRPSS